MFDKLITEFLKNYLINYVTLSAYILINSLLLSSQLKYTCIHEILLILENKSINIYGPRRG